MYVCASFVCLVFMEARREHNVPGAELQKAVSHRTQTCILWKGRWPLTTEHLSSSYVRLFKLLLPFLWYQTFLYLKIYHPKYLKTGSSVVLNPFSCCMTITMIWSPFYLIKLKSHSDYTPLFSLFLPLLALCKVHSIFCWCDLETPRVMEVWTFNTAFSMAGSFHFTKCPQLSDTWKYLQDFPSLTGWILFHCVCTWHRFYWSLCNRHQDALLCPRVCQ